MDWKAFIAAFGTIFLAELGDKTQIATLLYASKSAKPLSIFLASSLALVVSSALAVAVGAGVGRLIPAEIVTKVAGAAFVVIGVLLILGKF